MSVTSLVSPELTLNFSDLAEIRAIDLVREMKNKVGDVQVFKAEKKQQPPI